jgi:hypothetical protein
MSPNVEDILAQCRDRLVKVALSYGSPNREDFWHLADAALHLYLALCVVSGHLSEQDQEIWTKLKSTNSKPPRPKPMS